MLLFVNLSLIKWFLLHLEVSLRLSKGAFRAWTSLRLFLIVVTRFKLHIEILFSLINPFLKWLNILALMLQMILKFLFNVLIPFSNLLVVQSSLSKVLFHFLHNILIRLLHCIKVLLLFPNFLLQLVRLDDQLYV